MRDRYEPDGIVKVIVISFTSNNIVRKIDFHLTVLFEVESYDMNTFQRKTLPNMLTARSNFNPIISSNYVYVFGGQNESGTLKECERYLHHFKLNT